MYLFTSIKIVHPQNSSNVVVIIERYDHLQKLGVYFEGGGGSNLARAMANPSRRATPKANQRPNKRDRLYNIRDRFYRGKAAQNT